MGVYQGAFCGNRVKKVISEYYDIPIEYIRNRDLASGVINERIDKQSIIKYLKND